jgi:uncharacterized membrane protein
MIAYIITIIFGIIGFAITTGIRHHKKIGKPLVCPLNSDCNSVVYSSHSKFLGVDVTNLGLFYYGAIVCLYSTYVLFPGIAPDYLYVIGFLMTVTAVIFSVYLIIIQFLVIREWCFLVFNVSIGLYCTFNIIWFCIGIKSPSSPW